MTRGSGTTTGRAAAQLGDPTSPPYEPGICPGSPADLTSSFAMVTAAKAPLNNHANDFHDNHASDFHDNHANDFHEPVEIGGDLAFEPVERRCVLDSAGALGSLREIGRGPADLPGSCHGATDLVLLGRNGVGERTGGDVWLSFAHGYATVLAMSIADTGTMRMPPGETNISRNHLLHALWNSPNAERVITTGAFCGGVLAPSAVVEQHGDIRGNVIASGFESHPGIIDLHAFDGTFPWLR